MEEEYSKSSRHYLRRAKDRLREQGFQNLFYAAFELRCGIEARMDEYLEAWDHISETKKKGWRIAKKGKSIEEAFRSGDMTIRWAYYDDESDGLLVCFYFTPVTSELKKAGKRLGNYLHRMKEYRPPDDPFWSSFRKELQDVVSQLQIANQGTLLGPPLMNPETEEVYMKLALPTGAEDDARLRSILQKDLKVRVEVQFMRQLPKEMEPEALVWEFDS